MNTSAHETLHQNKLLKGNPTRVQASTHEYAADGMATESQLATVHDTGVYLMWYIFGTFNVYIHQSPPNDSVGSPDILLKARW